MVVLSILTLIVGFHRLKKIISHLERPKIIIFAVGAAPESDRNTKRIKAKNFNGIGQGKVTFFYLRGGFDLEKLPGRHRIALYIYKLWVMRKDLKTLTDGERSILAAYSLTTNYSEKGDLKPMVDYIKGLYKRNQRNISI